MIKRSTKMKNIEVFGKQLIPIEDYENHYHYVCTDYELIAEIIPSMVANKVRLHLNCANKGKDTFFSNERMSIRSAQKDLVRDIRAVTKNRKSLGMKYDVEYFDKILEDLHV